MAFSYTLDGQGVKGHKRYCYGTFNCSGVTGGDIITGLSTVENVQLTCTGASVGANAPAVNETLPLSNSTGAVTIVTDSGQTGCWEATGL